MVYRCIQAKIVPVLLLAAILLAACSGAPGLRFVRGPSAIESQLLAEIALERGDYAAAVNHYLNVAQQSDDPEHARRATQLSYEYGFDAHAREAAKRWVKLDADDPLAHTLLGILQTRFGEIDAAWDSLAIGLGPPEQRTDQVYTALSGDLMPAATHGLKLFERFNEAFPDTPGITRSLAELAMRAGKLQRAIASTRRTLSLRPDWMATRVWLARLLLLDDQRSSAFEQMAFALESSPGVELELEFVRLLVAAGELTDAAARLERISARFPNDDAVALAGAELLTQAGEDDNAEAIYVQMLSSGRCLNDCYWYLSGIAYRREDYAGAIDLLRRISSGRWLQPATLAIAQALQAQGNSLAALEVLEDFSADYPLWSFDMLQPRARLLASEHRYAAAAALTAEALEYRPWSAELWLEHGAVLERGGQMTQALEAFRTAWERAPDNATTQNAYGYTLTLETRQYDKAKALIAQALEQEPANPAFMDSMGWVLFKQGERAAARVWLERALAAQNDPEIAAHLVELLWTSDERDAAVELLTSARAEFPDNRALQAVAERFLH